MLLQNRFCCFLFLWKFHIRVYYVWIIPIHRHPLKFILWSPNHPTWIHDLCCIHMYLLMHAHTPTHTCTHVHVHTYTMFGSCCWDKHQNKRNSGKERVYFRLLFSVHHKTTRTWNRKRNLVLKKVVFLAVPWLTFSYLSYAAQVHLPRGSTAHSKLHPPLPINNEENALKTGPQANLSSGFVFSLLSNWQTRLAITYAYLHKLTSIESN